MESKRGGFTFPLFFVIQAWILNKLFTVSYLLFTEHYSLLTFCPVNNAQFPMKSEQITTNSSSPEYKFVNKSYFFLFPKYHLFHFYTIKG
jgi:hypothetical protein